MAAGGRCSGAEAPTEHWYASARDVTEWLHPEHRVARDPLTLLSSREVFTDEPARAIGRHGSLGLDLGVLFIDIDSFKQVSDAVTTAARELGISVVADGVEDTEQLAELRRAGCGYAQGPSSPGRDLPRRSRQTHRTLSRPRRLSPRAPGTQ
jgi:hypothetical protein